MLSVGKQKEDRVVVVGGGGGGQRNVYRMPVPEPPIESAGICRPFCAIDMDHCSLGNRDRFSQLVQLSLACSQCLHCVILSAHVMYTAVSVCTLPYCPHMSCTLQSVSALILIIVRTRHLHCPVASILTGINNQ